MPQPKQPVTDDSIQVRQLSHYQFTWVAGEPGATGTWTLQLVLDQGAWEEVLTVDPDDADNLQDMLSSASVVTVGYGSGDQALGGLGVVGPTRMDYAGNMAAVRAVARYVGQLLAES